MKTAHAIPDKEAIDRFPLHLQQALHLASAILRRISEKRLDKDANESLINVVPTECGGNHDD